MTAPLHRSYGECPTCHQQCFEDIQGPEGETNILRVENRQFVNTAYGPGENWIEIWSCPECGTEFKERNGYP